MRQAVLDFDEATVADWGFAPFQDAGLLDAEVLSCEGSRGVTRMHVEQKVDTAHLEAMDNVQWWELIADEGSKYVYLVEFNASEAPSTRFVDIDRLPRIEQVSVHEGGMTLTSAGSQDMISDMVVGLEDAGVNVNLKQLRGYRVEAEPLDALTERQREIVETAFEAGYYDVPRRASTEDIAAEFGLDTSTISEHLQRAERNLIGAVLGHAD